MKLKFIIINLGQIAFKYSWDLSPIHQSAFTLVLTEPEDEVDANSQTVCCLELIVMDKVVIRNHPFAIKVISFSYLHHI